MKKILMLLCIMLLMSMTAFAGTLDTVKGFITVENVLASIGVVSIAMTGVPVPKAGTTLFRIYSVLKYLSGNFGFADHTKKK